MTTIRSQVLSKTAQNETPSDGLGRATIDWCFFIFPNPISILKIRDEQTGKPQYCKDAGVKGVGSGVVKKKWKIISP